MSPSFDPEILLTDGHSATLISAWCPECGAVMFPRRQQCVRCGSDTRNGHLPTTGVVQSYCRITFPLPGAEPPVTLVRVELSPQVIVQGVMAGTVEIGDRVAVVPRPIPDGAETATGFGFARSAS
ncbi:Zn-ribbon domain-containing OB-fold protein [Mycobacterium sp. Lab-001]|uniref:Zn-ribbon domain-containing OB-fold protein n=1 Tax=Mycobacterium sp. Lab-001 TaxID=3410136 RepID=UPI003D17EC8B